MTIDTIIYATMITMAFFDIVSFSHGKKHYEFKGIIITLGIFGTFVGIRSGIHGFNTSDHIDQFLPILLAGISTALNTSLTGMGIALLVSVLEKIIPSKHCHTEDGAINDILAGILKGINELKEIQKKQNTTIINNLSNQLIDAFRDVITHFDIHFENQFGNNFRQHLKAINKSIRDRARYEEHLKVTQNLFETNIEILNQSTKSITTIGSALFSSDKCINHINNASKEIEHSLSTLQKVIVSLEERGEEIASLETGIQGVRDDINELTMSITGELAGIAETLTTSASSRSSIASEIKEVTSIIASNNDRTLKGIFALYNMMKHQNEMYFEKQTKTLQLLQQSMTNTTHPQSLNGNIIFDPDISKAITALHAEIQNLNSGFEQNFGKEGVISNSVHDLLESLKENLSKQIRLLEHFDPAKPNGTRQRERLTWERTLPPVGDTQ